MNSSPQELLEPMIKFFEENCLNPGVPEFPELELKRERLIILQQAYIALGQINRNQIQNEKESWKTLVTWQDVCKDRNIVEVEEIEAALQGEK